MNASATLPQMIVTNQISFEDSDDTQSSNSQAIAPALAKPVRPFRRCPSAAAKLAWGRPGTARTQKVTVNGKAPSPEFFTVSEDDSAVENSPIPELNESGLRNTNEKDGIEGNDNKSTPNSEKNFSEKPPLFPKPKFLRSRRCSPIKASLPIQEAYWGSSMDNSLSKSISNLTTAGSICSTLSSTLRRCSSASSVASDVLHKAMLQLDKKALTLPRKDRIILELMINRQEMREVTKQRQEEEHQAWEIHKLEKQLKLQEEQSRKQKIIERDMTWKKMREEKLQELQEMEEGMREEVKLESQKRLLSAVRRRQEREIKNLISIHTVNKESFERHLHRQNELEEQHRDELKRLAEFLKMKEKQSMENHHQRLQAKEQKYQHMKMDREQRSERVREALLELAEEYTQWATEVHVLGERSRRDAEDRAARDIDQRTARIRSDRVRKQAKHIRLQNRIENEYRRKLIVVSQTIKEKDEKTEKIMKAKETALQNSRDVARVSFELRSNFRQLFQPETFDRKAQQAQVRARLEILQLF